MAVFFFRLAFLFFIYAAPSARAEEVELFVSAAGNDSWNGQRAEKSAQYNDGPFKTIERAIRQITEMAKYHPSPLSITVHLGAGEFFINKPIYANFDQTKVSAVLFQGSTQSETIITAARPLEDCIRGKNNLLVCDVKGYELEKLDPALSFKQYRTNGPSFDVYIGADRLQLARWPNTGNLNPAEDWAYVSESTTDISRNTLKFYNSIPFAPSDLKQAFIHLWPNKGWNDQIVAIDSINIEKKEIQLSEKALYNLERGSRFAIFNTKKALDTTGEWMLDDGRIYILPGKNTETPRISLIDHLLYLNSANNLTFENITFEGSRKTAIIIKDSNNISIIDSVVRQTGRHAINVSGGYNNRVVSNYIENTALGGIIVRGGDRKTLSAASHLVKENEVTLTNQIVRTAFYPISVHGVGNTVEANTIHDVPYIGIRIYGNNHLITKNHLYRTCLQTADCGAIYSAKDWTFHGNVVSHNTVHDIYGYGLESVDNETKTVTYASPPREGARGIYLDNGVSGIRVDGNLVFNVSEICIHINGGHDNIIENNILIADKQALRIAILPRAFDFRGHHRRLDEMPTRGTDWKAAYPGVGAEMNNYRWPEGNIVRNNIIASNPLQQAQKPLLRLNIPEASTSIEDNIFWNGGQAIRIEAGFLEDGLNRSSITLDEHYASGIFSGSIIADPIFVNSRLHDYRLSKNSPVNNEALKSVGNISPPRNLYSEPTAIRATVLSSAKIQ